MSMSRSSCLSSSLLLVVLYERAADDVDVSGVVTPKILLSDFGGNKTARACVCVCERAREIER